MKVLIISSLNYAAKRLKQEAKNAKLSLTIMSTEQLAKRHFKIDVRKYQALYVRNPYIKGSAKFLPKIIQLAQKFRARGKRVIDANITEGLLGQGKWIDYKKLIKASSPIPKTEILKDNLPLINNYPLVLKWIYGMGGKNVFFIKNGYQLKKTLSLHPKQEWLLQQYIKADREFEVYVIGFKAVKSVLAYEPKDELGANVKKVKVIRNFRDHRGYNLLLKIASRSAKVLGRELCKVDILEKNGKFYILEVNRNPGLVSFETLISYNIARDFIKLIKGKI